MQPTDIARIVDHTLLKPESVAAQIERLCDEAREYRFASVCVNPTFVSLASKRLKGAASVVCSVAGFPLGAHVSAVKADEARRAIDDGAREIDMVLNVGALKGGDDALVERDIRAVIDVCHPAGALCKVILECVLLTDDEKSRACRIARAAGVDFVKTSTGFAGGGATVADVALMAAAVAGTRIGVKAAGGIRSLADAQAMIAAGATRLGTSAGVQIAREVSGALKTASESADAY